MPWCALLHRVVGYCRTISAKLLVRDILFLYTYTRRPSVNHGIGPVLLGYERNAEDTEQPQLDKLPRHGDEDQVKLDVNRAFVYYPKCM